MFPEAFNLTVSLGPLHNRPVFLSARIEQVLFSFNCTLTIFLYKKGGSGDPPVLCIILQLIRRNKLHRTFSSVPLSSSADEGNFTIEINVFRHIANQRQPYQTVQSQYAFAIFRDEGYHGCSRPRVSERSPIIANVVFGGGSDVIRTSPTRVGFYVNVEVLVC